MSRAGGPQEGTLGEEGRTASMFATQLPPVNTRRRETAEDLNPSRPANAIQVLHAHEHITRARRALGGCQYAGLFQLINDTCGASVSNFQPPL